ncbi:MAG: hypothetical protein WAN31_04435 [Methylovirgula sp.]|jgi:hypothetical protein
MDEHSPISVETQQFNALSMLFGEFVGAVAYFDRSLAEGALTRANEIIMRQMAGREFTTAARTPVFQLMETAHGLIEKYGKYRDH